MARKARVVDGEEYQGNGDPSGPTRRLVREYIDALRAELAPKFDSVETRFKGITEATRLLHEDNVRVPTVVDKAVENLQKILETRLKCQEGDIDSVHRALEGRPGAIKDEIAHLQALIFSELTGRDRVDLEIFKRIETQFVERDKRTEQLALASSTAIAAALQAQKEAAGATTDSILAVITKMDASFSKLFDQMANLLTSQQKNTDDKIADIKARMDKGEGRGLARDPAMDTSVELMQDTVKALAQRTDDRASRSKGAEDNWKNLAIIGSLLLAGIAFIFRSGMVH